METKLMGPGSQQATSNLALVTVTGITVSKLLDQKQNKTKQHCYRTMDIDSTKSILLQLYI